MYGGIFMNGLIAFFACKARPDYGYIMLCILDECSHSITWNECHVPESVGAGWFGLWWMIYIHFLFDVIGNGIDLFPWVQGFKGDGGVTGIGTVGAKGGEVWHVGQCIRVFRLTLQKELTIFVGLTK
eukprot:scaffold115266_cov28-Attheya_sp.AAC.1